MFKLSKYLIIEKLDKLFLSFCLSLTFFLFIVIIGYIFNSQLYSEVDPELLAIIIIIFAGVLLFIAVPILVIIEYVNFSRALIGKHNSLFARLPISKVKIYFAHWISFFFSLIVIILNIVTFTVLAILLNNFVSGQQLLSIIFDGFNELHAGVGIVNHYSVDSYIFSGSILSFIKFLNFIVFIAIFFQAITSSYLNSGLKVLVIIGNIALNFILSIIANVLIFSQLSELVEINSDSQNTFGEQLNFIVLISFITLFVFMIRLVVSIVLFVKEPR